MNDLLKRCPHLFQAPARYLMPEHIQRSRRETVALPNTNSACEKPLREMSNEEIERLVSAARAEIATNNARFAAKAVECYDLSETRT